ncbi:MAG: pimeloyl-ACP methyl ester carboxylesterase [Sulfitobacter sp.]|jgi:pimeloyl-ACP methyl ester carboxylesterase
MAEPQVLTTPQGRQIAYHLTEGVVPGVVFLGGFRSDMDGTKALHLEAWAKRTGRAFLRFDYSGHGKSGGDFLDGCIGDWAEDAGQAIQTLTRGPQVLVGSSMGGWISLLISKALPKRIWGLVTIAAAPDFTEDSMWAGFSEAQIDEMSDKGVVHLPSSYGDPYPITWKLIVEGRKRLVLRDELPLPFPVRFLQGTADEDVGLSTALRLMERADCPDMQLTLVDGADHRFSTAACLDQIEVSVTDVLVRGGP